MKNGILSLTIVFSFICCLSFENRAQIFVKVNYNFFDMSGLKDLQSDILSDIKNQGIEARITESYPAFFGFQAGLLFPLEEKFFIGGFFDHTSTGGRIHYSDYSGEIKADQIAKANSIGGILSLKAVNKELFNLDIQLCARFIFISFDNEFLFRIGEEQQKQKYSFSSFSFGIEPGVVPSLVLSSFNIGLSVSYLLSLSTTLEYDDYEEAYLTSSSGEKVGINWSGLKLGVIVIYTF
jgi:hypothetical protein